MSHFLCRHFFRCVTIFDNVKELFPSKGRSVGPCIGTPLGLSICLSVGSSVRPSVTRLLDYIGKIKCFRYDYSGAPMGGNIYDRNSFIHSCIHSFYSFIWTHHCFARTFIFHSIISGHISGNPGTILFFHSSILPRHK